MMIMISAPYAVKSLIFLINNFIPANVDIKYVCGVGIESRNRNRDYVQHAVRDMGMTHMNFRQWIWKRW